MTQLRTPTNPASFRAAGIETDDGLRAEYDRFCADLKADFPAAAEYFQPPTFEEFKLAMKGDADA